MATRLADYRLKNHGSLWLVTPTTKAARRHLQERVTSEAQWWAGALVVEPRYVAGLAAALVQNGWSVQ
jgi:hypothetical protein